MIDDLVPCGNPVVAKLISTVERGVSCNTFTPIVMGGVKYCAWCGKQALAPGRRKYCSDACRESCNLFCFPQTDEGLKFLLRRQECKCATCGYSWELELENARERCLLEVYRRTWITEETRRNRMEEIRQEPVIEFVAYMKKVLPVRIRPEVDHIIPVALGGTTLGFENLQALCHTCHKKKTVIDVKQMAEVGIDKNYDEYMTKKRAAKKLAEAKYQEWLSQYRK